MHSLSLIAASRELCLFSACGRRIAVTSLVVKQGFLGAGSVVGHTGLVAPWHVESSWPGIKSMSPLLAGRFLTTGPPGKSHFVLTS